MQMDRYTSKFVRAYNHQKERYEEAVKHKNK